MRISQWLGLVGVFLLGPEILTARIVTFDLWVSGGAEGVMMGGREAPGWLGVSRHITHRSQDGFWLDAGGTEDWAAYQQVEGLRLPDAVAPSEEMIRRIGERGLADTRIPWTLLNVSALPQFPDYTPPVPPFRAWRQRDAVGIRVFALLSGRAPLRIPPAPLRPVRVEDPDTALRNRLAADLLPVEECVVVVLPEDADPATWSKRFPGVPVLVEPAGRSPQVVEVDGGRRLRVRPGAYGRAVIRVTLRWDTVERVFRAPTAAVEWVRPPDLENLDLPPGVAARLRPRVRFTPGEADPAHREGVARLSPPGYLRNPEVELTAGTGLPDAWRIQLLPEDTVWTVWRFTDDEISALRRLDLPVPLVPPKSGKVEEVWIPARLAAGNGGDGWLTLRRFLDEVRTIPRFPAETQRQRLVPEKDEP